MTNLIAVGVVLLPIILFIAIIIPISPSSQKSDRKRKDFT